MKKIIYKYNENDSIVESLLKYILSILLANKLNLQYDYEDVIQEIEEYKFIRGFDHFGDDFETMYNKSYHDIREYIDSKDEVLGFNTLGFLKSKINLDTLISNEWINCNNIQGIFVKNVSKVTKNNFEKMYNGEYDFFNLKLTDNFIHQEILNNKNEILDFINTNKINNFIRFGKNEKVLVSSVLIDNFDKTKIYDVVLNLNSFESTEKIIKLIESDLIKSHHKICLLNKYDLDKTKFEKFFTAKNISVIVESNDDITNFNIMLNCSILVGVYDKELWVSAYLSQKIDSCFILENEISQIKPIINTIFI